MKIKYFVLAVNTLILLSNIAIITIAENHQESNEMIQFKEMPIILKNIVIKSPTGLNNPPNIPSQPSGPTATIVGNWYVYTTVTTDPDGDNVSYGWDGGDNIVNYWTGYYPSGAQCIVYIKFLTVGTYRLQAKARDEYGLESNFSQPLYVAATGSSTNHPPYMPSNPNPPDQAVSVDITNDLSWSGGDPDPGDSVRYDVYFGSMLPLQKVASNISMTTYHPGFLFNGLTYFWSVISRDNHGLSTQGPMWHFTTIDASNNPPEKPSLTGPSSGRSGRSYTYSATAYDADSDQVYYIFDWDDGTDSGWVGPYSSGSICQESHIWTVQGSYAVKVKAKDSHDAESIWSDPLAISIPKNKAYSQFHILFNSHPVLKEFLDHRFLL